MTFPSQQALADVSLDIRAGEVHALLGENGSGKSTLIRILSGYHHPDPGGSVAIAGQALPLGSPAASHARGLRFVHQHLAIIPEFNAVENVALDTGYTSPRFIRWKRQEAETRRLLALLGITMDIRRPLAECRAVERSAVAIARAINTENGDVEAVILDEPTSTLPESEVEQLFRVIAGLAASGIAVVYVTHRLDEVFQIADRVTVLRDGRSQGTVERAGLTRERLVEMIVGRQLAREYERPHRQVADTNRDLLNVENLTAGRFDGLSFTLGEGEVLGVVGIAGSGHEDVARALVGAIPWERGSVHLRNRPLTGLSPRRARALGLILGLSNTTNGSALKAFTVMENVTLASLRRYRRTLGPLRSRREEEHVRDWVDQLDVRPRDPGQQYGLLSGGNQQKVIFARCLNAEPSVLLLENPTAGVDVGARQSLYRLIGEKARRGLGVIVCSNDVEDIVSTCHRVLVLRQGQVVAVVEGDLQERQLMSLASHSTEDDDPIHPEEVEQT